MKLIRPTSALRDLRDLGGGTVRSYAGIALLSLVGGFVDALVLFLLVRLALAMSAGQGSLRVGHGLGTVGISAGLGVCGLMLVVSFLLATVTARTTARVTTAVVAVCRTRAVAAFLGARWEVQSLERPSQVQEMLSNNVGRLGQSATFAVSLLIAAVQFLAFTVSAVVVTPLAALVLGVGILVVGVTVVPLSRRTRHRATAQARLGIAYTSAVTQAVQSAREATVFGVRDAVEAELSSMADGHLRATYRTRFLARLTPVAYQLVALGLLLLGLVAAHRFGARDLAALGAMIVLLVRAISYGQQISSNVQQLAEMAPYLAQLRERIALYEGSQATLGSVPTPDLRELELRGASVRYPGGPLVLQDVDLRIRAGESIGVVGPSGSGKSTLVQVLLRLREQVEGDYLYNGVDVRQLTTASWFGRVALVPQENQLLPGTVAENIRFYRSGFPDEQVRRAAERAHLLQDVLALPQGFDTLIGPSYRDLSGGQKQRLGFARALLGRPELLVLDEPTSALDMPSEALLQRTLAELRGTTTCVIVAHRLSTLKACDRVVVLEQGRVTAVAPADDLTAVSAFFRDAVDLSAGSA